MRLQKNKSGKLTRRMFFSLILAVIFGLGIIMLRENLLSSGKDSVWNTINNILFADISADGNEKAIGLFYIIGQLFVKSLQVIIVPMVFTSIVLAIIRITDSRKLGRIASRTICYFLITTLVSIIFASGAFHQEDYKSRFIRILHILQRGSTSAEHENDYRRTGSA